MYIKDCHGFNDRLFILYDYVASLINYEKCASEFLLRSPAEMRAETSESRVFVVGNVLPMSLLQLLPAGCCCDSLASTISVHIVRHISQAGIRVTFLSFICAIRFNL